ncbi:MAG: hypothetical protein M3Q34_04310 [bacterium]|nr:hypothetical protein [bacterium]
MNFINLLSILESKNNLSDELFKKYLEYQNIDLKDNETKDLINHPGASPQGMIGSMSLQ